eukprot:UC1_evm2s2111
MNPVVSGLDPLAAMSKSGIVTRPEELSSYSDGSQEKNILTGSLQCSNVSHLPEDFRNITCMEASYSCPEGYYCPYGAGVVPEFMRVAMTQDGFYPCNATTPLYSNDDIFGPATSGQAACSQDDYMWNFTRASEYQNLSKAAGRHAEECIWDSQLRVVKCLCPYGFYCGVNTQIMQFCPAKYYCPAPETILVCPEGSYCRPGQVEPFFCHLGNCAMGADRDTIENGVILCTVLLVSILIAVLVFRRLQRRRYKYEDAAILAFSQQAKVAKKKFEAKAEFWVNGQPVRKGWQSGKKASSTPLPPVPPAAAAATKKTNVDGKEVIELETIELNHDTSSSSSDPTYTIEVDESKTITAAAAEGKEVPLNVTFEDIGLVLSDGRIIMEGVTGSWNAGETCAIMGPSGAGKTTIMTLVLGRAAKTSGIVRVNGKEVPGLQKWKRRVGYVPQEDVMHRRLTVRQNISFAARYRLPAHTTVEERKARVAWTIDVLGLSHVQHTIIGDESKRGISGGQRKRVNIGLELVANPRFLFLDEPTSGLDSATSNDLVVLLRKLAREQGLTIASVIHSPTPQAFAKFDKLLLLQPGGRTVYMGPVAQGPARMQVLGYEAPDSDESNADYMLRVASSLVHNDHPVPPNWTNVEEGHVCTPADYWAASELDKSPLSVDATAAAEIERLLGESHMASCWRHTKSIVHDFFSFIWNTIAHLVMRLLRIITCSRLLGECKTLHPADKYPGVVRQFGFVFRRALLRYFTAYVQVLIECCAHFVLGIFLAIQASDAEYEGSYPVLYCLTVVPGPSREACITPQQFPYMAQGVMTCWGVTFASICVAVYTFGGKELPIYWREASSGLLSLPYFLAKILIDMMRVTLSAGFFTAGYYILFMSYGTKNDLPM